MEKKIIRKSLVRFETKKFFTLPSYKNCYSFVLCQNWNTAAIRTIRKYYLRYLGCFEVCNSHHIIIIAYEV